MIRVKISGNLKKIQDELNTKLVKERKIQIVDDLVKKLADATPVDTGNARDNWRAVHTTEGSEIINDVEYISELNAGSSLQAPAFFVEKTLIADGRVIPNGTMVLYK